VNSSIKLLFAVVLSLTAGIRAVSFGTALSAVPQKAKAGTTRVLIPRPVHFREVPGRGLLASVWVNSTGPFTFAIDTGAGATLISPRVAAAAHLSQRFGRGRSVSGLSGATSNTSAASVESLALGDRENVLPYRDEVTVTTGLPPDIDGVLDPTEALAPLGYVIDIPRKELSAFDPQSSPIRTNNQPEEGAIVPWLRERDSHRPFVLLDNGDRALIDTGSSLGLAIRDQSSINSKNTPYVRDIGGGRISTRRVRPTTVSIGMLMLRNVPTDVLSGTEADAPVLLGLSALRPFKLSFDPRNRLIEIVPSNPARRY
jgi:predicted aspartyl protease